VDPVVRGRAGGLREVIPARNPMALSGCRRGTMSVPPPRGSGRPGASLPPVPARSARWPAGSWRGNRRDRRR